MEQFQTLTRVVNELLSEYTEGKMHIRWMHEELDTPSGLMTSCRIWKGDAKTADPMTTSDICDLMSFMLDAQNQSFKFNLVEVFDFRQWDDNQYHRLDLVWEVVA